MSRSKRLPMQLNYQDENVSVDEKLLGSCNCVTLSIRRSLSLSRDGYILYVYIAQEFIIVFHLQVEKIDFIFNPNYTREYDVCQAKIGISVHVCSVMMIYNWANKL